jgi:hypothetical protein
VSDDRETGGPLFDLLQKLPSAPEDIPREAVHARVLPAPTAEGAELIFICWRDPGGARALHAALRPRVEGSLLGELARTQKELEEVPSALTGLRLFLFADVSDADDAVSAFGLSETNGGDTETRSALARVRHEASLVGEEIPTGPPWVYAARCVETDLARTVEEELVRVTDDIWGRNPGAPFARLRRAVAAAGGPTLTADLAGVTLAERVLFTQEVGVLRWVAPLTFQALLDLVAVAIDRDVGTRVDWAEAAPDDDGIAPPPMIRVAGTIHVPLALEVLRFCVMPRRPNEKALPLADWVKQSFG